MYCLYLFKDLKNELLTNMTMMMIIIIIICCNNSSGGGGSNSSSSSSSSSSRSRNSSINDNKVEHLFLISMHVAISKEMYVNIT